jgi:hypothetical protein
LKTRVTLRFAPLALAAVGEARQSAEPATAANRKVRGRHARVWKRPPSPCWWDMAPDHRAEFARKRLAFAIEHFARIASGFGVSARNRAGHRPRRANGFFVMYELEGYESLSSAHYREPALNEPDKTVVGEDDAAPPETWSIAASVPDRGQSRLRSSGNSNAHSTRPVAEAGPRPGAATRDLERRALPGSIPAGHYRRALARRRGPAEAAPDELNRQMRGGADGGGR